MAFVHVNIGLARYCEQCSARFLRLYAVTVNISPALLKSRFCGNVAW